MDLKTNRNWRTWGSKRKEEKRRKGKTQCKWRRNGKLSGAGMESFLEQGLQRELLEETGRGLAHTNGEMLLDTISIRYTAIHVYTCKQRAGHGLSWQRGTKSPGGKALKNNLVLGGGRLKLQHDHVRDALLAALQGNCHSIHQESQEDPKGSWDSSTDCWCWSQPTGEGSC